MKKLKIPVLILICILIISLTYIFKYSKKINYTSSNLGITLSFPHSWENKYTIKDTKNSLSVYYKPTDSSKPKGLLFSIINANSKNLNPDEYDRILKEKFITINNQKYLVGGPTDIGFPDDSPEFNTYQKMKNQSKNIIESIK